MLRRLLPYAILLLLSCVPLAFSFHSLRKGQVIKQFFAYSISESLARDPLHPLKTALPCNPPRVWAEEPPVFHGLAAIGIQALPKLPALIPILAFLLLGFGMLSIARELPSGGRRANAVLIAGIALLSPVFLRYGIQHLPDLLAAALLSWGVAACIRGQSVRAALWMTAAVTTKALVGFAAAPVLAFAIWRKPGATSSKLVQIALAVGLTALPFALWVSILQRTGTPNPFAFATSVVENRHSGSLALLLDPHYYARVFTWLAIKGVGLPLFALSLVWIFKNPKSSPILFLWCLCILPYWALVRQANSVHDYYVLPFAPAFALAGATQLVDWARQARSTVWTRGALGAVAVVSIGIGIASIALLRSVETPPGSERPMFCEMEKR